MLSVAVNSFETGAKAFSFFGVTVILYLAPTVRNTLKAPALSSASSSDVLFVRS